MAFQLRKVIDLADNCKSFTVEDTTGTYNSTSNPTGYDVVTSDPNVDISLDVASSSIAVTKWGSSTTYTVTSSATLPNTAGTLFTVNNTDLGLASTDTITDGVYRIDYTISCIAVISATSAVTNTITLSSIDLTGVFIAGYVFTVASGPSTINGTYTVVSSLLSGANTVITVASMPATTGSVGANVNFNLVASSYELFFCTGTSCLNNILQQIEVEDCVDCMNTKIEMASKFNVFLMAAQYAASCGKPNKATVIINYLAELCDMEDCSECG